MEVVNDFKYLGVYIVNCQVCFKRRRGLAWSQFWKLTIIWKIKEILLSLKLELFESFILSIIFYGAKTLTITKVVIKEINAFGTICYQYMLGLRRIDKVRNEKVLKRVRRNNPSNLLYKRQLRSLGHWICKDDIITRSSLHNNNNERNQWGDRGWVRTNT